jgi:hypothetical protein
MVNSLRIEIKLKIEDLLVDREQWKIVCPCTTLTCMSTKEWEKLKRRARGKI